MIKLEFTVNDSNLTINDGFVLPKYTILVGKNNSGKSRILKSLYSKLQQAQSPYQAFYASPERFGALQRNSGLEDVGYTNRLAKDKEKLDNEFVEDILSALQKLEDEIKLKAKMPKSLAKIGKINSIICVGAEIIKTENISKEEREGHEKIMGIAA